MMEKNKYPLHYLDYLAEHIIRPVYWSEKDLGPCVPLNIVEDMVRHYFLNTSSKSANKGVDTELITKAVYNLSDTSGWDYPLSNLDLGELMRLANVHNAQISLIFEPECVGIKVMKNDWWINTYYSHVMMRAQNCDCTCMIRNCVNEFIEEINKKENKDEVAEGT